MAFIPPKKVVVNTQQPLNHNEHQTYQKELLKPTLGEDTTFSPLGISIDDIDLALKTFIEQQFLFVDDKNQKKIENYFFSEIQRFSQFTKTWDNTDEDTTIQLPFIVTSRFSTPKKGTMLGSSFNIPNKATYSLSREEKIINGRKQVFYYEIPQPLTIDLDYEITIFANHRHEINVFNEKILDSFKEGQLYLNVKSHNMIINLDATGNDKSKYEIEERKFLSQVYNFTIKGFILDEKLFKIKSSITDFKLDTEICNIRVKGKCESHQRIINGCGIRLYLTFTKKDNRVFEFKSDNYYVVEYTNNNDLIFKINNVVKNTPFFISKDEILEITAPDTDKLINAFLNLVVD